MIEYKGIKKVYGNVADTASATYIDPRLVVRPILTTEADFDEAGNIQGKLAEPKVFELKRDQLVHWDTYLLGRGTNIWNDKAPGFDVNPIEAWKNNSEVYGKLSMPFAAYGTVISVVDGNGAPVDLSQITANPGTYTVTYEIGFELPGSSTDPIRPYLSRHSADEFPGYPEWPVEGNRMVLGTASLTAKVPYKLSYDANGGKSTAPDAVSFMKDASVTIANQGKLSKNKAESVGWNTQANGNGTSYAAGKEVTFDVVTTLYAQWKEAPVDNAERRATSDTIPTVSGDLGPVSLYQELSQHDFLNSAKNRKTLLRLLRDLVKLLQRFFPLLPRQSKLCWDSGDCAESNHKSSR